MFKKHGNLLQWIALTICVIGLVMLIMDGANAAGSTDPQVPFDHEANCQYPDRTTNPVNGCDNSDPCDPATVKGGSGDCLAPSVAQNPVSQNVITVDKPVERVHNSCE